MGNWPKGPLTQKLCGNLGEERLRHIHPCPSCLEIHASTSCFARHHPVFHSPHGLSCIFPLQEYLSCPMHQLNYTPALKGSADRKQPTSPSWVVGPLSFLQAPSLAHDHCHLVHLGEPTVKTTPYRGTSPPSPSIPLEL